MVSGAGRTLTWTSFNKPKRIATGATTSTFDYAPERMRTRQVQVQGATTTTTTYVGGVFEQVSKTGEATRRVHYIFAGGERVAVYTKDDAPAPVERLRYLHTDHLGSVDTITDESGAVVERLSYEGFGKRRTASGAGAWTDAALPIAAVETPRGFTGHEHLDALALVHMNGRVYDPVLGRFVSADPYIQFPESTQGLNRYSYVRNNPLHATDPNGYTELFGGDDGPGVGGWMDSGADMGGYDAVGTQTGDGGVAMFDTDTLMSTNPANTPDYYSNFIDSVNDTSWSDLFDGPDAVESMMEYGLTSTAPPDGVSDDEVVETMNEVLQTAGVEFTQPVFSRVAQRMQERRPITYVSIGYTDSAVYVGNHALVIGTDPVTGEQYATRAGPEYKFAVTLFGPQLDATIEAVASVFDEDFVDTPSEVHTTQALGVLDASFADFSASARDYAAMANRGRIPYYVRSRSSNTYAFSYSERLGFGRPHPSINLVPGWDRELFRQ